jgi:hypothetical protein
MRLIIPMSSIYASAKFGPLSPVRLIFSWMFPRGRRSFDARGSLLGWFLLLLSQEFANRHGFERARLSAVPKSSPQHGL